jgi:hypothetical protein
VQTSSFAPEFGHTSGGQISIVTRSGTNHFHGTAFEYFRNSVLDANDWFSNRDHLPRPAERQNDFGGVFGGPILRDKTFFFFAYEGLRLRQPATLETAVPDTASRQDVVVAAAENRVATLTRWVGVSWTCTLNREPSKRQARHIYIYKGYGYSYECAGPIADSEKLKCGVRGMPYGSM